MSSEKVDYKEIIKYFDEDENCYGSENSKICEFFTGKYVFLTGGTGFLGKLTIEKLLRMCPDISGIFMLVRTKKGKDVHTRVEDVFNGEVFQRLSNKQPKFRYKIIPVSGDVGLPGLGLRIEDRKVITEKVSVIIHGAATVRFDEKLHIANNINVKGTEEILNLARDCKNLISLVHVSTAFAHCPTANIEEKFYEVPITPEKLSQICDNLPVDVLEKITPDLVGKWPNTYTFTKAIAEEVVRKHSKNLPVCVFRPSIILSTYKEPLKGWIDNIYGPTGYFLGCGLGLLRTLRANKKALADVIPADMVINGIIAAAYQTAQEKKTNEEDSDIKIYNYVSSVQQPLTWGSYCDLSKKYGMEFTPMKAVWYYNLKMIQNETLYWIYAFFVHIIPALIIDIVLFVLGKKPTMLKVYKKIHKFSEVLAYFGTRKWIFSNDNVQKLYENLPKEDQEVFNFDVKKLNWQEYYKTYGLGVRQYILNESLSSIEQARKRYFRLKIFNYLVLTVLFLLGLNMIYRIISYGIATIF